MANPRSRMSILAFAAAIAAVVAIALPAGAVPLKAAKMIIEFNASAEDVGVQFFVDSEGWQVIKIYDPRGTLIFNATATGTLLGQGGGTELFVESVEPPLDELPLQRFFDRFPEGRYRFVGRSPEGRKLTASVPFSHDIPAGPEIVTPAQPGPEQCAQGVGSPLVVSWHPVEEGIDGEPIEIVGYQVIVEHGGQVFDIKLPGNVTQVTVPAQFLSTATDYIFEVLAIERGGNQTITEGCFSTAP